MIDALVKVEFMKLIRNWEDHGKAAKVHSHKRFTQLMRLRELNDWVMGCTVLSGHIHTCNWSNYIVIAMQERVHAIV